MSVICSLLNNQETRVQESALTLLYELLATRHSLVVQTLVLQHTKRHRAVRGRLPSVVRRAANEGQTANGTQRKSSRLSCYVGNVTATLYQALAFVRGLLFFAIEHVKVKLTNLSFTSAYQY